ncbi:MAG: DUF61 family protein [Methanomicrobiales archaeon]|nr:DUF61 family protein [Methanomicrobiales archaeon]
MTHRPRITEEPVLSRWMGMEIARINDSIVSGRRTLAALLAEEDPTVRTKGGGEYRFSRGTLAALGERLDEGTRRELKLPLLFFFDVDVRDSCYLTDEAAVRALQALGDLGAGRRLTDGRVWVSRAIAFSIAQRYPTAVQFAMA